MENLIRKRSAIKTKLTKFLNSLEDAQITTDLHNLKARLEKAEPLFDSYDEIQLQIEDLAADEDQKHAAERDRENFEHNYYNAIGMARAFLSRSSPPSVDPFHNVQEQLNLLTNNMAVSGINYSATLPKMTIPKFDGDCNKWIKFRDSFMSIVDKNTKLSNIQKFHYLEDALEGKAAKIIESMGVSDENYTAAWNKITERYENNDELVHHHVTSLFNLPVMTKNSHIELQDLIDNVGNHILSLTSLKEPTQHWDTLLIHIIMSKVTSIVKSNWEKKLADDESLRTYKGLIRFLETECKVLKKIEKKPNDFGNLKGQNKPNNKYNNTKSYLATTKQCDLCPNSHPLYKCEEFLKFSFEDRAKKARELKVCYNCLNKGHGVNTCNYPPCKRCNRKHNILIHIEKYTPTTPRESQTRSTSEDTAPVEKSYNTRVVNATTEYVMLGTAMIYVYDKKGIAHECRAFLDSLSQPNLITRSLCEKLGLKIENSSIVLSGIEHGRQQMRHKTTFEFRSLHTDFSKKITCLLVDEVDNEIPCPQVKDVQIKIPKGINLADANFKKSRAIDILIGASLFYDLLSVGRIKLADDQPTFQKTVLGWIVSGTIQLPLQAPPQRSYFIRNEELDKKLEKFWTIENGFSNINKSNKIKQDAAEKHFKNTIKRDADGRFVASIPFEESKISKLGDSKEAAYNRFLAVEKKLQKNSELNKEYSKFMKEYEELGHMTEIIQTGHEDTIPHFYLPHHAVFKEGSTTTKLRVVFDGSAKTSSGLSLNDIQHVGQPVQDDLFSIILRFRQHRIVLSADIAKMYRQIKITESERAMQRILWRYEPNAPLKIFELNTVTYGTASAPFLATRCLYELGKSISKKHPLTSNTIIHDFYVDDLLTGADCIEAALQLRDEITQTLNSAGLELRKWASNNSSVIGNIDQSNKNIAIQDDKDPKTLGLVWQPKDDSLNYRVNFTKASKVTKRIMLSTIAQIYDPLGLAGPATIAAKSIMQRTWKLDLEWDASLPQDLHSAWLKTYEEIMLINNLKTNRKVAAGKNEIIEYHGFSDASKMAYGACIYACSIQEDGTRISNLLVAKSKVAPVKTTTIPRLELLGAYLLAQLAHKVSIACNISKEQWYFWTDSTITLAWIRAPSYKWKIFVANRVAEIQEITNDNWNHVISEENPADLISRGVTAEELRESQLWWHGPEWLKQDKGQWPNNMNLIDTDEEQRSRVLIARIISNNPNMGEDNTFDLFYKYSSFMKLKRVTAYIFRFVKNCRESKRQMSEDNPTASQAITNVPYLQSAELTTVSNWLIKKSQQESFSKERLLLSEGHVVPKSSKLIQLHPFLDALGIIRVGGRLEDAPIPYEKKHPAILAPNHKLTKLIINYEHRRLLHAGCQATLASLRERLWIVNGKNAVRKILHKCIICVRARPSTLSNLMGNLPSTRVTQARAFLNCGVDYAGPFLIKEKTRSRVSLKAYLCVFVCFATKAVHIELAVDLSTEAFLNCLKRFTSRRGLCKNIYSDNGTNFVGAKNELNDLKNLLNDKNFKNEIYNYCSSENIEWHFIPPHAPHFGGLWESAVKTAKYHLKRVIGETRLTYEELYTLITQIEACMNSRPLTPLSNDPDDLTPLTPAHFLIGDSLKNIPEGDIRDIQVTRLNRYQLVQQLMQHFWQRWHKDYLPELQKRQKWNAVDLGNIKPGMIVLIKEDNVPPMQWPLGRIVELHPGSDGVVRVITIRVSKGSIKRPITKICKLPIDEEIDC